VLFHENTVATLFLGTGIFLNTVSGQKKKNSLETLQENLLFFVLLFHAYRFAVSGYSLAKPKVLRSSLME